jgi:hypothetical protein
MDRHRFFVRRESDRWSFGRDGRVFARFRTKDPALKLLCGHGAMTGNRGKRATAGTGTLHC